MTVAADPIPGAEATQEALRAWQAVRGDAAIQYAPATPPKPTPMPEWAKALGRWLRDLFEPVGQALGLSWPVLQWILIALAGAVALYAAWRLAEPLRERRRTAPGAEAEWAPDAAAAQALLGDADALAASGDFAGATHLLLQRSVAQIAAARPGWVHPASTARELAGLSALPAAARRAFAIIAIRVEASRFALQPLAAADWQAARDAYAEFARQPIAEPAG